MVILNTKFAVRNLFKSLKDQQQEGVHIYHLSTSMCPAHRNSILKCVQQKLKRHKKVICLSTQLIEAGVDISFESVIRSLAGLDSIAQAAGRCNRHGEKKRGKVYLIDHKDENLRNLEEIREGKEITKKLLMDIKKNKNAHGGDLLSLQAMEFYFMLFYEEMKNTVNYNIPDLGTEMTKLLGDKAGGNEHKFAYYRRQGKAFPLVNAYSYRTAADYFKVIDDYTTSFLVPYEKGEKYIAELNGVQSIEDLSSILQKAQHYTVNLYDYEVDELRSNNQIMPLLEGRIFALLEGAYDDNYGVELKGDRPLDSQIY